MLFFSEIVPEVASPFLRARLADLAWTFKRALGSSMALAAVDAYFSIPLTCDHWFDPGKDCYTRAIDLVCLIKTGVNGRLTDIQSDLINAFQASTVGDAMFGCSLAEFILEHKLAGGHFDALCDHLIQLSADFESKNNYDSARQCLDVARIAYAKQDGKSLESAKMASDIAALYVKEAESQMIGGEPHFGVAASLMEMAVSRYMSIPKREREALGINDTIPLLRRRMEEVNRRVPENMRRFSVRLPIEDMIEESQAKVRGKPIQAALIEFATLCPAPNIQKLRATAVKNIRSSFLSAIAAQLHYTSDGRLAAVCPAVEHTSSNEEFAEKNSVLIRVKMLEAYKYLIHARVSGAIYPALEIMHAEHTLAESDFLTLAQGAPIVPPGRAWFFAKALYTGYEQDFSTAVQLLVPQIENMVRYHLKNAGEVTTTHDSSGISQEIGLSKLMERPTVESVFGSEAAFEISSLFTDGFGPNLRNEVAHGLASESLLFSADAIYAWWLCLSFITMAFFNRAATEDAAITALNAAAAASVPANVTEVEHSETSPEAETTPESETSV